METLEIIYRDKSVMHYIRSKVDEVGCFITNVDKLEKSIYDQLQNYYSRSEKRSFKRIRYLIDREIGRAQKQFSKQKIVVFSDLSITDDFGESFEYEPIDVLADVSETALKNISLNEKISGLASTDSEKFVLNAWCLGLTDTAIASELALRFGGNAVSKRKWVQRFRDKCQLRLTA